MNCVLIKLCSGDELICMLEEDALPDAGHVHLSDVRKVMHVPTPQGALRMVVNFWAGNGRDVQLNPRVRDILALTTPDFDLEQAYREAISGIILKSN